MRNRDPRVDAYIAKSADFAQPILSTIREAVHASCPDVEEAIKWSFPHRAVRPPTKVSDLPSKKILAGYIRKAAALNDQGVKARPAPKRAAPKTRARRLTQAVEWMADGKARNRKYERT